jgi:hypothetical protein
VNTTAILQQLPASLEWMVLFRLDAIRPLADDARIRAMYYLPDDLDLAPYSHVVLTSAGRLLGPKEGETLFLIGIEGITESPAPDDSLYRRHRARLTVFPPDEADCVGFGMKGNLPPVLLHLTVREGYGEARAILRREPVREHYELLRAVGVEYLGGEHEGGYFVASFRNKLPVHLQAGALAHFSRTGNCNGFFLNHGEIDSELESGLMRASEDRTKAGFSRALAACALLAKRATTEPLAMTCQPPPPAAPFPYGDLVPLGFLLRALNLVPEGPLSGARHFVEQKLLAAQSSGLWAFHTGRLVTATDSVLILMGLAEPSSVESLERFADGSGGYYPQLWSETKEPGRMLRTEAVSHWCQTDFATTCLVRGLRASAGLDERTRLAYLEHNFANRAGLYFANPYLVDWALAGAIRRDEAAGALKARLLDEVVASRNEDFSFGQYDVALSTSLAILTMGALGFRGRTMRMAQIRLIEMVGPSGVWPESTPFYSTLSTVRQTLRPQLVEVAGTVHELSLYYDTHRIIGTALAAEALGEPCSPELHDIRAHGDAHPRYGCPNQAQYVAKFALPSYVGELVAQ